MIDAKLYQFATVRQLELLEAIEKHGSISKAARALDCGETTVRDALDRVKRKAALAGYAPENDMTRTVPDGFKLRGVSTLYDRDGKQAAQWVKTTSDDKRQAEMMREAIAAAMENLPRLPRVEPPEQTLAHLCNVYTLTDSHVGMLAWRMEGGADWDLRIAEDTLVRCFGTLVSSAPQAKTCVVAQLGDFLHFDSLDAVTPTSKHLVDADGRFGKVVQTAIRILRRVIDFALHRHERVIVLMAEGNHDLASSVWLRAMFAALYEHEPRVQVIESELPYYVVEHGKTMLAWHHGHLHKNDKLPILFAAQFPELWGRTRKRYAHTGHRHHLEIKEHSGMTVVQHSTLAARDAYAARGGWLSERQVRGITYHSEWGEVATTTITPEMLFLGSATP